MTLQTDGRGGYNNIPAFSSKSAGIKTMKYAMEMTV